MSMDSEWLTFLGLWS